ncbi:Brix domain-containing protein, partial [Entophlyctis helioformis]
MSIYIYFFFRFVLSWKSRNQMVGHRRKKKRTHVVPKEEEGTPKSFVIKAGSVGRSLAQLVRDTRKAMEPNTATRLRERRGNKLKDFVSVAGPLGVTHMLIFSRSKAGLPNLRIGRSPRGPTLSFHISAYSNTRDVMALQKNPRSVLQDFLTSPLVVLNNFGGDAKHIKLMATVFQNLFPTIRVQKMKLTDARRVVLFNFNAETGNVEFRHYSITVKTTGLSKSVKTILSAKIPDLNSFNDIGDFILRGAFASESDVEDAADSTVTLGQNYGKAHRKSEQRAVRLIELGPRLDLQLVKIQSGMCGGEVIYHSLVTKTKDEIKATESRLAKKRQEKDRRRAEQQRNVDAKKLANKAAGKEDDDEEGDDADMDDFSDQYDDADDEGGDMDEGEGEAEYEQDMDGKEGEDGDEDDQDEDEE